MPKGTGLRARYAHQACDVCRVKKIKCDGLKPICGPCIASSRKAECAWLKEPVRKPRSEAHFEALRKRVDALESYSQLLEQRLAGCHCQNNDGENAQNHIQLRPQVDDESDGGQSSDGDITQELCMPTERLKLDERDLLSLGNTTPFRFSQPRAVPSTTSLVTRDHLSSDSGSYTLLLDGVAESQADLACDWTRHLPSDIVFDRREHDRILDHVFKYFTCWCMRVVPALFLRDMHRYLMHSGSTQAKTPHYSPMLHNALLALGSAYSSTPEVSNIDARRTLAAHAKGFIEAEVMRPNVTVVNALAILGSFHSGHGEVMLAYMYWGMSTRIAEALGLNIDASSAVRSGRISSTDLLDRNWMYWSMFAQDVCWSTYVGRSLSLPAPPTPQHLRKSVIFEGYDDIPWTYAHAESGNRGAPQPNALAKTHAAACDLLLVMVKVMDVVNHIGRASRVADKQVTDIDIQLYSWKEALPPFLQLTSRERPTPHKLMVHAAYWWCFILLHRPFFHQTARSVHGSDPEVDHIKLCKRAADNSMELFNTWRELHGLRFSNIPLAQMVFATGTIHLLLAADAASTSRARVAQGVLSAALGAAERCVGYLFEMGRTFNTANLMGGILQHLLRDRVKPLVARKQGDKSTASLAQPSSRDGAEIETRYTQTPGTVAPPIPTRAAPSASVTLDPAYGHGDLGFDVQQMHAPILPDFDAATMLDTTAIADPNTMLFDLDLNFGLGSGMAQGGAVWPWPWAGSNMGGMQPGIDWGADPHSGTPSPQSAIAAAGQSIWEDFQLLM
ncbi:Zn(2)-C6 fungal-type domain-containing protein [Mycena indigotica]|uniref:Zn(2)-C6 fungal-type domain-containing protein n=1 Tax=Mycena indigotica TaxID=2126181 RepID=A0A8H6W303_9AGAR|nr:Zn(2)-C6 fungal-type domain-containing protein [Mycena indigotica]KAF7297474.1 Zn(2)-C6 fungal-type domain-containing protein [Mycena indigotica]